ncbi:MAG: lantibiotic dehydratase, partial [Candidatus Delongbacteria bacterium]|nr:lantibiotic dehydratase [Candidatus Delongbacteria bacterium]
ALPIFYWNRTIALLDRKIFEALSANEPVVELSDEDARNFDSKLDKMAPTFSVVAKITGRDGKGADQIYISSAGGSSSVYLLGRFCHADKETDDFVKLMVKKEEEILKDFIVAEIVHLPQARVGNVLLHPQFHEYEIPYLAKSNSDTDHQIQLDDIYLSLYGKKLIMRSKKHNKVIIPRLSNAHNFSFNAQPIYQFLCEMQYQDMIRGVNLPLSNAIDRYGHVPRIVYKNIILHLAEWKIKKKEVEPFSKIKDSKELIGKVTEWRTKRKIPGLVMLEEGDNTLLINLENSFCIRMLLSSLKGEEFKLKEFLFDENNAIVKSDEGVFLNEFVISYFRNNL